MITFFIMYVLFGAIAGVLAGLLGLGGGILLVPLLVMAFQMQGFPSDIIMYMALGTSLASIVFTAFSSTRTHNKKGGVRWVIVKQMSIGIMLGTYLGSCVAAFIAAKYLQIFFAIFLFYVTAQMLMGKTPKASRAMPNVVVTNLVGMLIGFVSSLVGIGGGTLSVPFMMWHNIGIREAIGTSAAIGMFIAFAGAVGFYMNGLDVPNLPEYSAGFIYLPALLGIVLTSILTAPIGARLAHSLPVSKIKKVFSFLLFVMGLRMLWFAFA